MADNVAILRTAVREYSAVDDQLKALNEQIFNLRRQRSQHESEIVRILADPQFAGIGQIENNADGTTIKIKRPGTWKSGWSLPKSSLKHYTEEYFATPGIVKNAETCFDFIAQRVNTTSVGHMLKIER